MKRQTKKQKQNRKHREQTGMVATGKGTGQMGKIGEGHKEGKTSNYKINKSQE